MNKTSFFSFVFISFFSLSLATENKFLTDHSGIVFNVNQSNNLPKAYGFYLVDKEELLGLVPMPVKTIIGLPLRVGNIGYAVDGIAGEPSVTINSTLPVIIVYQQNVDVNNLVLCDMVYEKTMEAQQFNIQNTDKRFFSNVYARDYYDIVDINLWRPKNEISISIEPVEGKMGMYKFIPKSSLIPGNYVFFFKGEVHKDKTVFSSDLKRKASAFFFNIKSNKEKTLNAESSEENMKKLLIEAKVSITSAKNYDIRYSAAPDRTAASKERATIIIYLDKASDSLNNALELANEMINTRAINLIRNSRSGIERAREYYMGGKTAYSEVKKIESELNDYIKEMSEAFPLKDMVQASTQQPSIEANKLKDILEETLTILG
jgi:hypothetical protein